jgi:hypothetical protein
MLWVSILGDGKFAREKEDNEKLVNSSRETFQFMTQTKEALVGKRPSYER